MTMPQDNAASRDGVWQRRLSTARVPLCVSTAVFGGLWLTGLLGLVSALVSFVIVAAATIVAGANSGANPLAARQEEALDPPPNDAAIETVLKGLPSPAVALGRRDEI